MLLTNNKRLQIDMRMCMRISINILLGNCKHVPILTPMHKPFRICIYLPMFSFLSLHLSLLKRMPLRMCLHFYSF